MTVAFPPGRLKPRLWRQAAISCNGRYSDEAIAEIEKQIANEAVRWRGAHAPPIAGL